MPTAPPRLCTRSGCRGLVRGGVCSVCGPRVVTGFTHTATRQARGYGADWQRFRAAVIENRRLESGGVLRCDFCGQPILGESIHADHREPFAGLADPRRLDPANIRLSHRRCHMQRTAQQRHGHA